VAVAHVEHRDADTIEVALAKVGDRPAEPVTRHAAAIGSRTAPMVGTPVRELRQSDAMLAQCLVRELDGGVDLRTLHGRAPNRGWARSTLPAKTPVISVAESCRSAT